MTIQLQNLISGLNEEQIAQFEKLKNIYLEWNKKINVVSRKDTDNLVEKHFLHSLLITRFFSFEDSSKIIDIGTGGGFPGIPLAIFYPKVSFTLVDSISKKIKIVNIIKQELGLNNITPICNRIENVKESMFDSAVSRAVAPLSDLIKWSKPLLKKRPSTQHAGLLCLKGGDIREEVKASQKHPIIFDLYDKKTGDYYKEKYLLFIPVLAMN